MLLRLGVILELVELREWVRFVEVVNLMKWVGLEVEVEGFGVDRWFIFGVCSR